MSVLHIVFIVVGIVCLVGGWWLLRRFSAGADGKARFKSQAAGYVVMASVMCLWGAGLILLGVGAGLGGLPTSASGGAAG